MRANLAWATLFGVVGAAIAGVDVATSNGGSREGAIVWSAALLSAAVGTVSGMLFSRSLIARYRGRGAPTARTGPMAVHGGVVSALLSGMVAAAAYLAGAPLRGVTLSIMPCVLGIVGAGLSATTVVLAQRIVSALAAGDERRP